MLGSPCSPCCGPPECNDEQTQAIFDSLAARPCSITLPAGLPYQDEATLAATPGSMVWSYPGMSQTPEQYLRSIIQFRYFRQHETASGTHSLALDLGNSYTFTPQGELAAILVFRKSTISYEITLTIGVRTLVSSPEYWFVYPGTQCYASAACELILYRDSTNYVSGQSPPNGVTNFNRPFTYSVNGVTPSYTLALANAPYYSRRDDFAAANGYSVDDAGQWATFDAAWNASYKPSAVSWNRQSFARYSWYGSMAAASTQDVLLLDSQAVVRNVYEAVFRWENYSTALPKPDWIANVNFASPLVYDGGLGGRFAIQYESSPKFYSAAQMASSQLSSAPVTLG